MNKQILCPECREHSGYIIKKERKKYIIRNKEYHFNITVAYCKNCGKELDIPGLIDLQMKEVDEQYRKEENIVSINEIKNLMTLYDIKKETLSIALGFEKNTITFYLKGQVPSKKYSNIIRNTLECNSF